MTNIPTTGELFATNQVSPDTERCYKYQLRNFANWMADSRDVRDMESVSVSDLLAYRQSIQHLAASSQLMLRCTGSSLYWLKVTSG